jgi:hypothetical protein
MSVDSPDGTGAFNVLWLQSGGCGGCNMSLLCADTPDFSGMLRAPAFGCCGIRRCRWKAARTPATCCWRLDGTVELHVLCVEGAMLRGPNGTGRFHVLAGTGVPMIDWVARLASVAPHGGDRHLRRLRRHHRGRRESGRCLRAPVRRRSAGRAAGRGVPVAQRLSGRQRGRLPDASGLGRRDAERAVDVAARSGCARYARPAALLCRPAGPSRLHAQRVLRVQGQRRASVRSRLHDGAHGLQGHAGACRLQHALWNGDGSCTRGGYACISCTEPGFEEPGHAFHRTPNVAGIPIGLPSDMPKAWFVALASLSKAATPKRGAKRDGRSSESRARGPFAAP